MRTARIPALHWGRRHAPALLTAAGIRYAKAFLPSRAESQRGRPQRVAPTGCRLILQHFLRGLEVNLGNLAKQGDAPFLGDLASRGDDVGGAARERDAGHLGKLLE